MKKQLITTQLRQIKERMVVFPEPVDPTKATVCPGSTVKDAIELAVCLKKNGYAPEQVQDYYPTPGTASTVMYYTGINPLNMRPVYVATDYHEKQLQRALLQYNRPQNADLVREALTAAGRTDLIGYGAECLVRPATGNAPRSDGKKPSASRRVQSGHASTHYGKKDAPEKFRKSAQKSAPKSAPAKKKTGKKR